MADALQLVWRAAFLAGVPEWLQVTAMEPDVSGTDIFVSLNALVLKPRLNPAGTVEQISRDADRRTVLEVPSDPRQNPAAESRTDL